MIERIDADVCVVGAGYAGLTAARRLTQTGQRVVVLEARDRVGGRVWTRHTDDGAALDMGGTWLAPGHDAAHALAKELGVSTYPTNAKGTTVFLDVNGKRSTYGGGVPKIGFMPLIGVAQAMLRIDAMARSVSLDTPWDDKHAEEWDAKSVGEWVDKNVPTVTAKALLHAAVRGLLTEETHEISMLHLLYLVKSAGGINTLLSIEGGYQQDRLSGGAQSMANIMARDLGDALRLQSPVRAIEQDADGVTVRSPSADVRATRVVVAVPPGLAARIDYTPALPEQRMKLLEGMPAGEVVKAMAVYETPFWRDDGCSGESVAMNSPIETTLDASPQSGRGVIAAFAFGPIARTLLREAPEERRRIVIETLRARFGDGASNTTMYDEQSWETEEWTRGCSAAHMTVGTLTRYGPALRPPTGRIHWAGSETAAKSHLAIDGAIRSGHRTADEILALSS